MAAYYNENDPKTAAWLRELIKAGLIADGEVDDRSIELVRPDDLRGFVQCHFFAGIGGWSYALRLAGWPDDRAVWTGSCPCQPWSSAGSGLGADDSRDLWSAWFELIRECAPTVVFGEQVASAGARPWLDRVYADMEHVKYAVGALDLPAASVGAFHIRQRLWFVADASALRRERWPDAGRSDSENAGQWREGVPDVERGGVLGDVAVSAGSRRSAQQERPDRENGREAAELGRLRDAGGVGYAGTEGLPRGQCQELRRAGRRHEGRAVSEPSGSFWADAEWLACIDGKARPVEPGTFPLAHGLPARVGRLRGYGNAINPHVAKEVIAAYMEIVDEAGCRHRSVKLVGQ